MNQKLNKFLKIILRALCIIAIVAYAYSLTPKTFQNDTFYTIKIGEFISENTEHVSDLLPWNKGLDMKDHYSFHNLPYTYPHWLYDFFTYKIYNIGNFQGVYWATCILAVILALLIYFINLRWTKNDIVSFLISALSIYGLKNFIAARAQLVTFILFVLTIFGIEEFLKTKKLRYAILLIVIPILIANLHCAVWPFYFILYLPYIAEYLCVILATANYGKIIKKFQLFYKTKIKKNKISKLQLNIEKNKIKKLEEKHNEKVQKNIAKTNKLEIVKEKNIKILILIMILCLFTGLLTPIKDTVYTYLVKTTAGNTTQSISEHLPLTLAENINMVIILVMVFGILIFSKCKIKIRDFFMLMGLIALSFMSQRQVSMLVLIGNFILARLVCDTIDNIKKLFKDNDNKQEKQLINAILIVICVTIFGTLSVCNYLDKKNDVFIDESSYPVAAAEYINRTLIPEVGKENLRLYNEYNYGSYLLFSGIPVFIDSRADLYSPEFNGEKDEEGDYVGNDIFSDFIGISNLSRNYEDKFEEYNITHAITYSNSKLNSLLVRDDNYVEIYSDSHFTIYERVNANE